MKKVLVALLMAAVIMPAFIACKKGAEDPSISLKSRNARLIAEWKLKGMEGTYQYYSGATLMTRTYNFDGTTYSETINPGGVSISGTGNFTMEVAKDGIYTFSESFTPSGGSANVVSGEDYWYWSTNDNNKIAVNFGAGGSNLFWSGQYEILELSSKELKVTLYWKYTDNGETEFADITWTFEAQ